LLLVLGALALAWPGGRIRRLPRVPVVALGRQAVALAGRKPRQALAAGIGAAALLGLLVGGPVGAVVMGAYAGIGGRALMRRDIRRRAAVERSAALDELAALAADLRAGLPPSAVPESGDRLRRLTGSVHALAERTGAPAADLVERIEADARAADRAGASASAQAAGAQATSMLLAALPLAGIGLGFLMGADPFQVLFHTPLGAACALVAVVMQTVGLLWSERLMRGVMR
jgi:tight adherence protein B